jgi:hypothetical protein
MILDDVRRRRRFVSAVAGNQSLYWRTVGRTRGRGVGSFFGRCTCALCCRYLRPYTLENMPLNPYHLEVVSPTQVRVLHSLVVVDRTIRRPAAHCCCMR